MLNELCRCNDSHGYKRTTEKLRRQPKLANCLRKSPTKITSDDENIHEATFP